MKMFRIRNIMWRMKVWCIISWYALVISGLPLPVAAMTSQSRLSFGDASKKMAAKDCTTPFPCMNKPCGCMSAKQCFQRCCCHTPDETLAWAKRHGVSEDVLCALQRRVKKHEASHDNDFQQHMNNYAAKQRARNPVQQVRYQPKKLLFMTCLMKICALSMSICRQLENGNVARRINHSMISSLAIAVSKGSK